MKLRLGDMVKVRSSYRYADEWRGDFFLIGMRLDDFGRINITLAEARDAAGRWISPTDGFRIEDLELVRGSEFADT